MTDSRLQKDLKTLTGDGVSSARAREPLPVAPTRPSLAGGRGEASEDDVVATGTTTGGGPPLPWTWVRNETRIEQRTDSDNDTFDEQVIEVVVLRDADGDEFDLPTGL